MGGYGSWDGISRHPETFAAALPICGGAAPDKAHLFTNRGIWAFHGDQDNIVPYKATLEMCAALHSSGNTNLKATIYREVGHTSWDAAYKTPEAIRWLLAQRKDKPPVVAARSSAPLRLAVQPQDSRRYDIRGRIISSPASRSGIQISGAGTKLHLSPHH